MAKYHVNKHGEPAVCKAVHNCPLGGENDHIETSSPQEAREFAEKKNAENKSTVNTVAKKKPTLEQEELHSEYSKARQYIQNPSNDYYISKDDLANAPNADELNKAVNDYMETEIAEEAARDEYYARIREKAQADPDYKSLDDDSDEILDLQAKMEDARDSHIDAQSKLDKQINVAKGRDPEWTNDPEKIYAEPSRGRFTPEQLHGKTPNLKVGSTTPWGKADHVEYPAQGIAVVGTPGHGGVKLSARRNKAIPESLRNSDGWYEEDLESQIVGMHHTDAFPHYAKVGNFHQARREFEKTVRNWYPDEYEEATGRKATEENSYKRREQAAERENQKLKEQNKGAYFAGRKGANQAKYAPGHVAVRAENPDTGEVRTYLMKSDEYKQELNSSGLPKEWAVDPDKHVDVTDIENISKQGGWDAYEYTKPKKEPKYGDNVAIDTSGLTPAARKRAEKELSKRYKFPDGQGGYDIKTDKEHIESIGVTGKSSSWDGNKETYRLYYTGDDGKEYVHPVNKATYDAVTGVDSLNGPLADAQIADGKAEKSVERAEAKYYDDPRDQKAKQTLERARQKRLEAGERYNEMSEANRKQWKKRREEVEQEQREAFQKLAQERGLDVN